jgi:hypothetical protein
VDVGSPCAETDYWRIDEILAEGTRVLAAQDVPRIRAATDVGNVPMARAFERAGWINFERAVHMTWADGT